MAAYALELPNINSVPSTPTANKTYQRLRKNLPGCRKPFGDTETDRVTDAETVTTFNTNNYLFFVENQNGRTKYVKKIFKIKTCISYQVLRSSVHWTQQELFIHCQLALQAETIPLLFHLLALIDSNECHLVSLTHPVPTVD